MLAMLCRTIRLIPDASAAAFSAARASSPAAGSPYATEEFDDGRATLARRFAADLELPVLGERVGEILEPVRVAGPVVEGDRVTDALAGDQLPQLH